MFGLSRGDTVVLPAIAAVVSDIVRDFLSLASALEHQEVSTTQVTDSSIKDELTRFKVCVGNLAAQRPVHRSLEYRLRDAPDLKGDVHNLLRALSETIQNMSAILRGERVPWDAYELSSSGSESESSEDDLQDSTELHQLLSSCHNTITSLFRLSIAIRDPAPAPYYTMTIGAEKSFHERYDTLHVQEKYPDCPVYLAKRLGRGISSRRQYLSYREEHRLNLLESIEKLGLESIGTEHTKNSTEVTSASVIYKQNTVEGLSDEDFASQTSFAASVNASIRVPPLPKDAQTEDFFECPLCFMTISLHTEAAWKKHVFEDLHPYCCTFEECTTADRLYDHRRNWFNHELTAHRGPWQCVEGCGFIFTTEHEFESHVRTLHPELTSVLPAVRRTSLKRPSMSEKVTCLLCTASITIGSLQKHLGSHQQTLTLFALPININEGSDSHEDYERSRGSPEIFRDMNDDTSGSNTPPELVEDSTSRDVSSTYETTLPRASRDLKKDLGQDNLGNAELSNVPMPGDYMESADDGSFGTHSRDNDITFSSLFRKPPTDNVATEKFATIGDKDLRGDTTPSTAEVGSSDNSKEVQIMSKSHLATINSQPLTQSADKQVLFARLGLNEQVHKLLVQDAQMARDRLSADASNLTDQSRLSPYITAPYRWDEISETAKHRILSEVVGNASPDVKHYYTLGSYRNVVNEENWVARWYLWHSFRCRDNR